METFLLSVSEKEKRQTVLVFGVIIAALIDHFDPKYKTVRRRGIYLNKLSQKSRKSIKVQLVDHYIPFIKSKNRYY